LTAPVDSVELKFTFSGDQAREVRRSFTLSPASAQQLSIYFFDSLDEEGGTAEEPRLRLLDAGVILRLRHVLGGKDNSTLKLRPARADRLVGRWRSGTDHDDDYRVEYDWAARPVLTASLEARVTADDLREVVEGRRRLSTAFSDEQEGFLSECGPGLADVFDDLDVAGPISALRWSDLAADSGAVVAGLRAEQWDYGDGLSFLELSARVDEPERAADRREQLFGLLRVRGLTPDAGRPKTETVLRSLLSGARDPGDPPSR
jgi:hypothetical protein